MFLLLPLELIKMISSEMDIQDVKSLRLTCRTSNEILAAQVLQSITINIRKSTVDLDMHKLRCLATRPCASATSHATHELTIKSLSPGYDPDRITLGGDDSDFELFTLNREPQPSPEALLAEDEMKKFLFDALSSFENVRRVSWLPIVNDRTWVQTTVMDALRTLTKINSLHVWINYCRLQVPFHWFSKLQEISIHGNNKQYHTATFENLAKMVAHSSQLNSINIKGVIIYGTPFGKPHSLHQLFQHYCNDAPPLRIHRLVLHTCLVRFDDITIPHLKYLTSLSLTNIKAAYPGLEDTETEQKRWGSSQPEIWSALLKEDIYLQEIAIDVVVPALFAYLASYSGLRTLNLTGGASNQEASDHLATQFYAKPLANHVQSLRKLEIRALYEGLWCVGDHNISLISQCLNLKHLSVSIISSGVDLDPMIEPSSVSQDVISRVIDMVTTSIPQLDTLRIRLAPPEDERFHFAFNFGEIPTRRITTYQAPPSCRRLPLLSVGLKQFWECQESIVNDGRLRYMPSPNNLPDSDYYGYIDPYLDYDDPIYWMIDE